MNKQTHILPGLMNMNWMIAVEANGEWEEDTTLFFGLITLSFTSRHRYKEIIQCLFVSPFCVFTALIREPQPTDPQPHPTDP